ncbi:fungal-specific transcription factor domain-containing protein [Xylariomycetidae sp. FL2044]|nr:fungal-specific transcription factor domain-containing protein [Xylariomycetidae sp. FL2044]
MVEAQPMPAGRVETKPLPPPHRRRDKPQLSCNLCRRRKLRCDRQSPCSTCAKHGLDSSCTYVQKPRLSPQSKSGESFGSKNDAYHRVQRLEDLVASLLPADQRALLQEEPRAPGDDGSSSNATNDIGNPGVSSTGGGPDLTVSDLGSLRLTDAEMQYRESSHWFSVLDEIGELKQELRDEELHEVPSSYNDTSLSSPPDILMFYGCKKATRGEILKAVPPRVVADRLVAYYFEAIDLATSLVHSDDFLRHYEAYWSNPDGTPITWVGMLFGMFCIATQFYSHDTTLSHETLQGHGRCSSQAKILEYREKTVQSLQLGKYTKGGPYVIETLIHYLMIEHALRRDADIGTWLITGFIIHLATRMGYHRDPKHFKKISTFDGEMRRRLWAMIYHIDVGISSQMGMPRIIRDSMTDTAEPRNIHDSDFNINTTVLPSSRDEVENTKISFVLAKLRMASAYALVSDLVTNTRPQPYSEVIRVEQKLTAALNAIPHYCKVRPLSQSLMDPAPIISQRIYNDIIYHKAKIVLHRRYLAPTMNTAQYAHSRRTAVESALQILRYHHLYDEESRPSGILYSVRWRQTSMLNHDFLLATSIICFHLQHNIQSIASEELDEIKTILRKSQLIWIAASSTSADAKKAAEALRIVLANVGGLGEAHGRPELTNYNFPSYDGNFGVPAYHDYLSGFQMPFSIFNSMFDGPPLASADDSNFDPITPSSLSADFPDQWFQSSGFQA